MMWHDAPESPIHMFSVNKENVSQSMVHNISASVENFNILHNVNFIFYFFLFNLNFKQTLN